MQKKCSQLSFSAVIVLKCFYLHSQKMYPTDWPICMNYHLKLIKLVVGGESPERIKVRKNCERI
jgi:hypothetical protein